ncbi:MAG: hypothetical protein VX265_06565 [Myxococcota bacterium]|nr:hypothetical protein [Myxococcota bacterium]
MKRTLLPVAASLIALGGCGKTGTTSDFGEVEFSDFSTWGRGLEDLGSNSGGGGGGAADSGFSGGGSGGGGATFDGTWQGSYSFTAELIDYGYVCSCSSDLTLGIVEGTLQVGQGGICNMDCGINTRLEFGGSVGETGSGAGSVDENTSFYFSTSWVGTFTEGSASGSFADTVSTDQGTANVSGSFSVAPL